MEPARVALVPAPSAANPLRSALRAAAIAQPIRSRNDDKASGVGHCFLSYSFLVLYSIIFVFSRIFTYFACIFFFAPPQ